MTTWNQLPPVVAEGDPNHTAHHNLLRNATEQLQDEVDVLAAGGGGGGGGTGDVTQAELDAAVAPKADKTYVDAQDALLSTDIDGNTAAIGILQTNLNTKASVTYVDAEDAALQAEIDAAEVRLAALEAGGGGGGGGASLVNNKSVVSEFDDPTNERFMEFSIHDDGTNTLNWPDRLQFRIESAANSGVFTRTGGFNEYGEMRSDAARINTVAARVHGHQDGSTGDIFQVRNVRGGSVDMLAVSLDEVKCQVPVSAPNLPPAVLTLQVGAPVPPGTPAGAVIVRY